MTPPTLIVLPVRGVNTHLAGPRSDVTWCGLVLTRGGYVAFQFEPGSDFGEGPHDCATCRERATAGAA